MLKASIFSLFPLFLLSVSHSQASEIANDLQKKYKLDVNQMLLRQAELHAKCERDAILVDMAKHVEMAKTKPAEGTYILRANSEVYLAIAEKINGQITDLDDTNLQNYCEKRLNELNEFTSYFRFATNRKGTVVAVSENMPSVRFYYHDHMQAWSLQESLYSKS